MIKEKFSPMSAHEKSLSDCILMDVVRNNDDEKDGRIVDIVHDLLERAMDQTTAMNIHPSAIFLVLIQDMIKLMHCTHSEKLLIGALQAGLVTGTSQKFADRYALAILNDK